MTHGIAQECGELGTLAALGYRDTNIVTIYMLKITLYSLCGKM